MADFYNCTSWIQRFQTDITGVLNNAEISLTEALSQIDETRLNSRNSQTTEFVFTGADAKYRFKKVLRPSEESFTMEGKEGHFEHLPSFKTRFLSRINAKDLLFSEFVAFYDYVGEESKEIYDVFEEKTDKIPLSKETSVLAETKMPEYILCNQNRRM